MQPTLYCSACGTQNGPNARFCQSCGHSMLAQQPVQVNVNPAPQRGSWLKTCGIIAIIGAAIVLVIVIATIIGAFTNSSSSGSGQTAPKPMLDVNVGTIYSAYLENEARANLEYKDRTLFLQFRVDEIEDRYVVQELGDSAEARLTFPMEVLVEYDVGESDQRECTLSGFDMDTYLEFDCK